MTKFLLQFEGAVIKEIPAKDEITVGRRPDNDVVIDNPAVSGHHCKIFRVGDTYFVEDLNSTNGVFLNAKKVVKSGIQNNDVIGIAKHALKFIDDRPAPAATPTATPVKTAAADATMMISPQKQQEIANAAANAAKRKPAVIRVLKGVVGAPEYELKNRSTYIGKSDHVQIKIKGTGLFGSAPESAAMIANHQDGYFIIPVKEGYVKLNGKGVTQKEILKDGDVIQAGGTTLKFEDPAGAEQNP
jgi:pSer/pThr/pTyr-binding forkhead associated (FHA) protein